MVTVETLVNTGGYGCLRLKVHSLIISIFYDSIELSKNKNI